MGTSVNKDNKSLQRGCVNRRLSSQHEEYIHTNNRERESLMTKAKREMVQFLWEATPMISVRISPLLPASLMDPKSSARTNVASVPSIMGSVQQHIQPSHLGADYGRLEVD